MTTPNNVNVYDIGDMIQLRATVIGTDGATPAQPSWFTFLVKPPNGSVATYALGASGASVVNPGAGAFFKDVSIDQAGSWYYRSIATGAVQAAEEWAFLVAPSIFTL